MGVKTGEMGYGIVAAGGGFWPVELRVIAVRDLVWESWKVLAFEFWLRGLELNKV